MQKYLSLFLFIIISLHSSFGEGKDVSLKLIKKNLPLIKSASAQFHIDYHVLSAIIFVERTLNVDWRDSLFDIQLARFGHNSSIGFCQVKVKTAYFIEKNLNDPQREYFLDDSYINIVTLSKSVDEIIQKLKNDSTNIIYAAAYIKMFTEFWKKEGFNISNKPEIVGTLYSTGLYASNGELRKPNKSPKANYFGKRVKEAIAILSTEI